MSDYRLVDFVVCCPRDKHQKRPMQIKFIKKEDGNWFPLPCNGCDELNGSNICGECIAAITKLFFEKPDHDTLNPIAPSIPNIQ